ncbi:hypothetical protein C8J56DRAFT_367832 [Mycena floridula]|nr:hypothetical protein C8J56DRAFT_367832 [Mycena floridula]
MLGLDDSSSMVDDTSPVVLDASSAVSGTCLRIPVKKKRATLAEIKSFKRFAWLHVYLLDESIRNHIYYTNEPLSLIVIDTIDDFRYSTRGHFETLIPCCILLTVTIRQQIEPGNFIEGDLDVFAENLREKPARADALFRLVVPLGYEEPKTLGELKKLIHRLRIRHSLDSTSVVEYVQRLHSCLTDLELLRLIILNAYPAISPIRLLPTEILGEIFQHSLASESNKLDGKMSIWNLMQVCPRWRNLIQNSPSLWRHVDIGLTEPRSLKSIDELQQFLRFSGALPLTVRFNSIPYRYATRVFGALMKEAASRIVELEVNVPRKSLGRLGVSFPNLRSLTISSEYRVEFPLLDAPNLTSLYLSQVVLSAMHPVLSQLQSIILEDTMTTAQQHLQILRCATSLKVFEVKETYIVSTDPGPFPPTFVHHSLQTLKLLNSRMLGHISLPALETLIIMADDDIPIDLEQLGAYPSLAQSRLYRVRMNSTLTRLLRSTLRLKELHLGLWQWLNPEMDVFLISLFEDIIKGNALISVTIDFFDPRAEGGDTGKCEADAEQGNITGAVHPATLPVKVLPTFATMMFETAFGKWFWDRAGSIQESSSEKEKCMIKFVFEVCSAGSVQWTKAQDVASSKWRQGGFPLQFREFSN